MGRVLGPAYLLSPLQRGCTSAVPQREGQKHTEWMEYRPRPSVSDGEGGGVQMPPILAPW